MIELKDHEVQDVVGGKIAKDIQNKMQKKLISLVLNYSEHDNFEAAKAEGMGLLNEWLTDGENHTQDEINSVVDGLIAKYFN